MTNEQERLNLMKQNIYVEVISHKYNFRPLSSLPRNFKFKVNEYWDEKVYHNYEDALKAGIEYVKIKKQKNEKC